MARPLREGSLGQPPAPPLPVHSACSGAGGAALLAPLPHAWGRGALVLREDPPPAPRRHPRLSCACPGASPHPNFILYRCGTRGHPTAAATAHDHSTDNVAHAGPPATAGGGGGAVANGGPPGEAPPGLGPEQELGARLRRLGDAFQRGCEQQRAWRGGGLLWGQLSRLVWHLLGALDDLGGGAAD